MLNKAALSYWKVKAYLHSSRKKERNGTIMSNQIVTQLRVLVCRKQVTILNPEVPNVMNHKSSLK